MYGTLGVWRKQGSEKVNPFLAEYGRVPIYRKEKKAGRVLCPPHVVPASSAGNFSKYLVASLCGGSGRLGIGLRDAEVSTDGVLTHLVNDDFLGNVCA